MTSRARFLRRHTVVRYVSRNGDRQRDRLTIGVVHSSRSRVVKEIPGFYTTAPTGDQRDYCDRCGSAERLEHSPRGHFLAQRAALASATFRAIDLGENATMATSKPSTEPA